MSTSSHKDLPPGEARFKGTSTRERILADGDKVPEELVLERYEFLGDADISYDRYTSQDFFDREMERMWTRVWQWACREEHIPEAGDHYVYDIGDYSILIVRSDDDTVKAFHNACLHRGTQLRPSDSQGNVQQLRCPFHGWTWNLDGSLKEIPCRWDFPHVSDDDYRLPEVRVGRWGGFIFINMDPDAEPLEDYLEVLPRHFQNWPLEDRHVALHIQKVLPANWKAAQEAFIEAYHAYETHKGSAPISGAAAAQYDIFGERTSRFVHTRGHRGSMWDQPISEQEVLDYMIPGNTEIRVPEGKTAREVTAEHLRKTIGERTGRDLSGYSDSEMLDSIEYHLFPNMFLFPGVGLPMIYRFRPCGNDPDTSVFDLLFLELDPPDGKIPEAPEPHRVAIDQSYGEVPGINPMLGRIYDEDTSNLAAQQKGFKASKKRGQTLGNYQEVRVRLTHQTLDRYLSDAK